MILSASNQTLKKADSSQDFFNRLELLAAILLLKTEGTRKNRTVRHMFVVERAGKVYGVKMMFLHVFHKEQTFYSSTRKPAASDRFGHLS